MAIEHKDITDPQIHEPKGTATALVDTIYVANGAGSGTWKKLPFSASEGDKAYGSMVITNNTTTFAMTAVADTTFDTPSQFSLLTGTGAPLSGELLYGITFSVNRLTVPYTGVYHIESYTNISSFPSNTARIALKYILNGTTYSSRGPIIKSAIAGDQSQMAGFGLIALNAGDYIQMVIASDTTGNLVIKDMNNTLSLVRRTA